MHGAHTIEINLEPSAVESEFAEKRYGKASIEVPRLVEEILAAQRERKRVQLNSAVGYLCDDLSKNTCI